MTLIVGLTGGIASGKSTISSYYQSLNIPIIDADIESRLAVEKGEPAYIKIAAHFGKEVLHSDGTLNRQKLGEIIFSNEEERRVLNSIVHPDVRRRMEEKQRQAVEAGEKVVILDIPLLFENKLNHTVDRTILVYVDQDTQIARLMKRNDLSYEQALKRINAQMPLQEKLALADEVINNNGSMEESIHQANRILKKWGVSPR
ncbi:dephospho-CoA kinase [Niallia circulans]|jgi:dephospho-CoA kinase|uniref:Dephospho-CoA kinase n=1 Tax=Niallia circulans TaxID=1397 RepID=A0A0J1IKJ4_NIACI|nr:dephospho-CoA kinase [Niallia circulans]KLV26469.1 dephospho-CoA kinase [Niallia circulans]MCM2982929.1 dephospho-CoA kinase [Niallia circulans]MDR4317312.1 dephospho-CoA kinase [Niallia circulans]MED3838804.1 dephospho-CoA kinase [Niallia circulans]MED4245200.1 dephospho-CoA kinase [Niallia circulans]